MAQIPCHACSDGLRDQTADGAVGPCPVCGDEAFGDVVPEGWQQQAWTDTQEQLACFIRRGGVPDWPRYYILDGPTPVPVSDMWTWAQWFETADRQVVRTQITDTIEVSTFFLAVDYHCGDGPALLFQTMVFRGEHSEVAARYATWHEAEQGHEVVVAQARASLGGTRAYENAGTGHSDDPA